MDEQPLLQGTSNDVLIPQAEERPVTPTAELVPNQLHMSGIGGGECNPSDALLMWPCFAVC